MATVVGTLVAGQALERPVSTVDKTTAQNSKQSISPAISLFSGGVAGAVEATATVSHPAQLQPSAIVHRLDDLACICSRLQR